MTTLTDLLDTHEIEASTLGWSCKCGVYGAGSYVEHLAEEIEAAFALTLRGDLEYGVRFFGLPDASSWVQPYPDALSAVDYARRMTEATERNGEPGGATAVRRPHIELPEWEPIPSEETE